MMHPQRLVLLVVLMQLLVPAAADGLTEDDLVYSEAWGTQSACSGCSYVKGHVIEKPKEEVRVWCRAYASIGSQESHGGR